MATILERIQYGFDRDSRRTWRKRSLATGQDYHYGYDGLSQVVSSDRGNLNMNCSAIAAVPVQAESWDYDPTGNWHGYKVEANGAVTLEQDRVHDKGNRLMQISGEVNAIEIDRAGRTTRAPDGSGYWNQPLGFKWDPWNRITEVQTGALPWNYRYDGLNRRITTVVDVDFTDVYFSDTWKPLEIRYSGLLLSQYFWGDRHRDDLARRDSGFIEGVAAEIRYVLMDYFNPAAITDEDGDVTERYDFSAFGVRRIMTPTFTPRDQSESLFDFAFQGQFIDRESGLLNYGYRYYAPRLGRWMSKDPIHEFGGLNFYAAAWNDMLNHVDYLGLDATTKCCWRHVKMTTFGDLPSDKVGTRDNKLKAGDIAVGHYGSTQHPKRGDKWVLPYGTQVTVFPKDAKSFQGKVADVGAYDKKHPEYQPSDWIDIWDPAKSKRDFSTEGWVRVVVDKICPCPASYFEAPCMSKPDGVRLWEPPETDPGIGQDQPIMPGDTGGTFIP